MKISHTHTKYESMFINIKACESFEQRTENIKSIEINSLWAILAQCDATVYHNSSILDLMIACRWQINCFQNSAIKSAVCVYNAVCFHFEFH